jgi:hypothetical protein
MSLARPLLLLSRSPAALPLPVGVRMDNARRTAAYAAASPSEPAPAHAPTLIR